MTSSMRVEPHGLRMTTRGPMTRPLVALICAGSAGVHAALVPAHLDENLSLGVAFAASAVALALAALLVRSATYDAWAPAVAAALLLVMAAAYTLSRTIGVPLLVSAPADLDALGVTTALAEIFGAAATIRLFSNRRNPA